MEFNLRAATAKTLLIHYFRQASKGPWKDDLDNTAGIEEIVDLIIRAAAEVARAEAREEIERLESRINRLETENLKAKEKETMFIRIKDRLFDTDKARGLEVVESNYGDYEARLELVWGFLVQEGCLDTSSIFLGTAGECQAMLDKIANAIMKGEVKLFKIKEDGTRREKPARIRNEVPRQADEEEVEIPF